MLKMGGNMNKRKNFILTCLLAIITIISGYLFLYQPFKEKQVCTHKTVAIIETVEEKMSETKDNSGDGRVFRCKYKYLIGDKYYLGYEYSEQYNNSWSHAVGEQVDILYNENRPTEFMLTPVIKHYSKWFLVPIISAFLCVLTILNVFVCWLRKLRTHKADLDDARRKFGT